MLSRLDSVNAIPIDTPRLTLDFTLCLQADLQARFAGVIFLHSKIMTADFCDSRSDVEGRWTTEHRHFILCASLPRFVAKRGNAGFFETIAPEIVIRIFLAGMQKNHTGKF